MFNTLKRIGLKCSVYKLVSRLFPKDPQVTTACDRIGAYRYLKRYEYILDQAFPASISSNQNKKKNIIWLCWLQGYDNAPLLVQKCRESVIRHNPNVDVIIIDNTNLEQYIQLPSYIKRKHELGVIPNAHYADLIRISLLAQYGGTWIDSTVYMTSGLPDYISLSDLFCYKVPPLGKSIMSNWFISSAPNNPIILQMKALLFGYWEKENRLVSYSIFHLFWTMIISFNKANETLWNRIPYFDDVNCKILQMELFDTYSSIRFQQIKSMSPIHKLTYKFTNESTKLENTFYKYLIQCQDLAGDNDKE